jgi:hypothetical protein
MMEKTLEPTRCCTCFTAITVKDKLGVVKGWLDVDTGLNTGVLVMPIFTICNG